jgi:signal transduction histidine kinase
MIRSLGFRLGVGAIVFVGLALFLTWQALSTLFTGYVMDKSRSELQAVIDGLTTQIRITASGVPPKLAADPVDQRFQTPAGGHYWQIAENGVAILRSPSLFDSQLQGNSTSGSLMRETGPDGDDVFSLSNSISISNRTFVISVAIPANEVETETARFSSELASMMGLTAVALLVAALIQILTGLAPLRRLGTSVKGIRDGTLARMPDDQPVELKALTNQLNTLLDERNLALARAQARANDLAHGLKTPLTILAHIGETLTNGARVSDEGARIGEQVEMVRQRVDRQLAMARISRDGSLATLLAPLSARLITTILPIAEKRAIRLESAVPDGLVIAAAIVDIAEVIGNVLDNAVEWATAKVWLSADRVKTGGGREMIRVQVDDDGPGIEETNYATALGRGGRLDESRKQNGIGSGLGLAIAADILEVLGGRISLARSDKGGLCVVLEWPKAV